MIGILGGMGTQAGLDFCNKLAILNRGKIDQEYPIFFLYNKSDIPGRPESISIHAKSTSDAFGRPKNLGKYNKVLRSLPLVASQILAVLSNEPVATRSLIINKIENRNMILNSNYPKGLLNPKQ